MKELKLTDFKGKYLVFFFYPLDFTFVCPTEILAFNDRVAEFKALNAEVIKRKDEIPCRRYNHSLLGCRMFR